MVNRGKGGKRPKNVKDSRNAKYVKIVKYSKDAKGAKHAKSVKNTADAKSAADVKAVKDDKNAKSVLDVKGIWDAKSVKNEKSAGNAKGIWDAKSVLDEKNAGDAKSVWDVTSDKDSRNNKNAKDKFAGLRVVAWLLLLTMIAGFSPSSERYSWNENINDENSPLSPSSSRSSGAANSDNEELPIETAAASEQKNRQVGRARTNPASIDSGSDASESVEAEKTASPTANQILSGELFYLSDDIQVNIEKIQKDNITYFAADVKISDASQLKTAFAGDKYGKSYRTYTSKIANSNDAIFAVNGDYHGFRDEGIIIRNSTIYRDKPSSKQLLLIDGNGDLMIKNEKDVSAEDLLEMNVVHTFSFGPALLIDGVKAVPEKYFLSLRVKEPRTAIGQIDSLHYLFVTVDGRRKGYSDGVTISELADIFLEYGCKTAYNLDGGGSATMVLNDQVVNRVSGGGERSIGDIVYIGR